MKKLLFIVFILHCWHLTGYEGITWWHMRLHITNRVYRIGLQRGIEARDASIVQAIDAWAAVVEQCDKSLQDDDGRIVGISEEHYKKIHALLQSIECKVGIIAGELVIQKNDVDVLYSDLPQCDLAAADSEAAESSSCNLFGCLFPIRNRS